jgi:Icc-related predicted phosphoesterase
MKLLCLSDIHGEAAGLENLLGRDPGVDVIVIVGDITHLGDYAEAEAVLGPLLGSGVRMVAVGGNMDREGVRRYLRDKGIDIHARGVILDGVGFMGLGGGTPSPFRTPWELDPLEAARCLAAGFAQIASASCKVLVSHAPPHATEIDRSFTRMHVGSVPVREFLLGGPQNATTAPQNATTAPRNATTVPRNATTVPRNATTAPGARGSGGGARGSGPVNLCICGHIHEAMGEDSLGGVTCVNVGPYKNGRYALIRVEDGRAEITWRSR